MDFIPKIALTMGDPAGIGPEIAVRAANDPKIKRIAEIIVYGCPDIIAAAAEKFASGHIPHICETGTMEYRELSPGKADAECGIIARNTVIQATNDAIDGRVDAIVTCPMNKASVNLAGIRFTGHTELIAELCGVKNFAMMQSAGDLRIAFVTTHISLREVSDHITDARIIEVANLLCDAVKAEEIEKPRIAAAAINPHAGENGYMGSEDEKVVKPALEKLRKSGMDIEGPFPPDTLFIEKIRSRFDGILSMYHDQGHIPFKMLAFEKGVNSTLGLPIIRTSVDHGTAFEIAWKGVADMGSLIEAIKLAAKRASNRPRQT
ncbi:MAG: 4-hydroxythreonine-4-phosphate dehydrogenase PdxA [Lentisphaerae bacterium GWF2_45_14]|nr:MAG: 4-hydroxythreonine-4-phosphate dehydrogenase PdxA [Lentisphaerae bacterium GWF2_45_14]